MQEHVSSFYPRHCDVDVNLSLIRQIWNNNSIQIWCCYFCMMIPKTWIWWSVKERTVMCASLPIIMIYQGRVAVTLPVGQWTNRANIFNNTSSTRDNGSHGGKKTLLTPPSITTAKSKTRKSVLMCVCTQKRWKSELTCKSNKGKIHQFVLMQFQSEYGHGPTTCQRC